MWAICAFCRRLERQEGAAVCPGTANSLKEHHMRDQIPLIAPLEALRATHSDAVTDAALAPLHNVAPDVS